MMWKLFSLAWNSILKTLLLCTVVVICIDSYEVNEPAVSSLWLSSDTEQREEICECSHEKQFICIFHDHLQSEWEFYSRRTTLVCLTFGQVFTRDEQTETKLDIDHSSFDDASRHCWLLSNHFKKWTLEVNVIWKLTLCCFDFLSSWDSHVVELSKYEEWSKVSRWRWSLFFNKLLFPRLYSPFSHFALDFDSKLYVIDKKCSAVVLFAHVSLLSHFNANVPRAV